MAPNSVKIRLRFSRADDNFCSRMVDDEEIRANAKQNTKPKKSSKGKEHAPNLSFLPVINMQKDQGDLLFHSCLQGLCVSGLEETEN